MIDDEKLNRLYNGVLEGVELTTKKLNEYGFNSKELTELVQNGTLERVQRGVYTLKSIYGLIKSRRVSMPFINFVYDVIFNNRDSSEIIPFLKEKK